MIISRHVDDYQPDAAQRLGYRGCRYVEARFAGFRQEEELYLVVTSPQVHRESITTIPHVNEAERQ